MLYSMLTAQATSTDLTLITVKQIWLLWALITLQGTLITAGSAWKRK